MPTQEGQDYSIWAQEYHRLNGDFKEYIRIHRANLSQGVLTMLQDSKTLVLLVDAVVLSALRTFDGAPLKVSLNDASFFSFNISNIMMGTNFTRVIKKTESLKRRANEQLWYQGLRDELKATGESAAAAERGDCQWLLSKIHPAGKKALASKEVKLLKWSHTGTAAFHPLFLGRLQQWVATLNQQAAAEERAVVYAQLRQPSQQLSQALRLRPLAPQAHCSRGDQLAAAAGRRRRAAAAPSVPAAPKVDEA